MSRKYIYVLFFFLATIHWSSHSQISYGGRPYVPQSNLLKSFSSAGFFEMPSFDPDSLLAEDALNEAGTRGSYRFAHKFHTQIEKSRDAALTLLPDGTRVWSLTICSKQAYSLNFLLENVSMPEGGKLFVYDTEYSHVVGQFDRRNISETGMLPIQPVSGETVVIEYSEPADAEFEGNFIVSEVNHDYRNFLRKNPGEPDVDSFAQGCMSDVLCENIPPELIRSTVLLVLNGTTACTGTLINNAEQDEKTYILTAVHCLNGDIPVSKSLDYYINRAGTVIAFFNYNRTACESNMKGTEEMSIAGSYPLVIAEKRDVALLEFNDIPPASYNAYYAGWTRSMNTTDQPYHNLHHPNWAVKKYGLYDNAISLVSYPGTSYNFDPNAHWKVTAWTKGSTAGGSSGSPLFNKEGLLIGGLTGGESTCKGENSGGQNDFFFSFSKAWEMDNPIGELKTFLNPENKTINACPGYDPYQTNPIKRLSNIDYRLESGLTTTPMKDSASQYAFSNNSSEAIEFAEAFHAPEEVRLLGAYLLVPPMANSRFQDIEVSVYTGAVSPETCIATYDFHPRYLKYSGGEFTHADKSTTPTGTENFVSFDNGLIVKGKFFISYRINSPSSNAFYIYNTENGATNSAWIRNADNTWSLASNQLSKSASLAILALVSENPDSNMEIIEEERNGIALHYDSGTSSLRISNRNIATGSIRVYSTTGQLIDIQELSPEKEVYPISRRARGSIGIVKIAGNGFFRGLKFVY